MKYQLTHYLSLFLALVSLISENGFTQQDGAGPSAHKSDSSAGKQSLKAIGLFYGEANLDNFTAGTPRAFRDAQDAGYRLARIEACVLRSGGKGTKPLRHFYSEYYFDNMTVASEKTVATAIFHGYREVGVQGYVLVTEKPGTIPLYTYYNPNTGDYFLTATSSGIADAVVGGYRYVTREGWVYPPSSCAHFSFDLQANK